MRSLIDNCAELKWDRIEFLLLLYIFFFFLHVRDEKYVQIYHYMLLENLPCYLF